MSSVALKIRPCLRLTRLYLVFRILVCARGNTEKGQQEIKFVRSYLGSLHAREFGLWWEM